MSHSILILQTEIDFVLQVSQIHNLAQAVRTQFVACLLTDLLQVENFTCVIGIYDKLVVVTTYLKCLTTLGLIACLPPVGGPQAATTVALSISVHRSLHVS